MTDLTIPYFAAYAIGAIGLCIFLARTLSHSGGIFLKDVFDDEETAEALNRLLVIGFLLLNVGYSLLIVRPGEILTGAQFVQEMSRQIGLLVISLGVIHFINLAVFWKLRRRNEVKTLPPPVPAQGWAHDPIPSWQQG